MRGSLKSGARKVRCIGFTDERRRGMNGEMRIWRRGSGKSRPRERKVKCRVICKFHHPSSHQPHSVSLSLSLLLIPARFSQSFFHFSESRAVETYTKYVLYIHVCTCTCAYICVFAFVFVRHRGVIARATKRRFAVLPLPQVLKELDRFIGIDSIPFR